MKKIFIESLQAGALVDDVFVLAEKTLARKRDGAPYLLVTLADRTGRIKGVMWDGIERVDGGISAGDPVQVKGSVSEYKGTAQLVLRELLPCDPKAVNPADFMPATARDVEKLFLRIRELTDSMKNGHLRELFALYWKDEDFCDAFKRAPAAKRMHHAYIGGLLEHTVSMALLADRIAGHYEGIDRDVLIAGVILHDAGKTREFLYDSRIDYSDQGRLVSHIVISVEMLNEKLRELPGFPPALAVVLKHLIISHHGEREFGSPEPPKTIEAVLLHYIDEIDAKVNGIRDFMAAEDPEASWTAYHRLLGRHFYKGSYSE